MLIIIGVIIGFVMGLTGAGGALVAIPLFMQFQAMSLKEASIYSLLAVVIASLSNFYFQRKDAVVSIAITMIVSSTVGSFISQPYKSLLPDLGIAITLGLIALYSLYSVWMPQKNAATAGEKKSHLIKTILIGLLLGVLTTFTGLGGGVLMLPVLLGIYKLVQKQAVATSLLVVGFSSLASFIIQTSKSAGPEIDSSLIGLVAGILVISLGLKLLIAKIPTKTAEILRRIVFTMVVILSLIKIF